VKCNNITLEREKTGDLMLITNTAEWKTHSVYTHPASSMDAYRTEGYFVWALLLFLLLLTLGASLRDVWVFCTKEKEGEEEEEVPEAPESEQPPWLWQVLGAWSLGRNWRLLTQTTTAEKANLPLFLPLFCPSFTPNFPL